MYVCIYIYIWVHVQEWKKSLLHTAQCQGALKRTRSHIYIYTYIHSITFHCLIAICGFSICDKPKHDLVASIFPSFPQYIILLKFANISPQKKTLHSHEKSLSWFVIYHHFWSKSPPCSLLTSGVVWKQGTPEIHGLISIWKSMGDTRIDHQTRGFPIDVRHVPWVFGIPLIVVDVSFQIHHDLLGITFPEHV